MANSNRSSPLDGFGDLMCQIDNMPSWMTIYEVICAPAAMPAMCQTSLVLISRQGPPHHLPSWLASISWHGTTTTLEAYHHYHTIISASNFSSGLDYFDSQNWPCLILHSLSIGYRLRRCIATINRWTDYCNNREIIVVIILDVSKTSQNNRSWWFKKIITPMVMLTP